MPGSARFGRPSRPLALVVGIVIVLIVAWVVVGSLATSDRKESFYPSLAEANKDGAITRGWIPDDLLPRSSHDIHEVHDLSPSTEWCAFEFVPTDAQSLLKNLRHVDVPPASMRRVPSPHVSWWPSVLVGRLDTGAIRRAGFDLYAVERPATASTTAVWFFAIDQSKGRAFFYTK
ncbi:MAG: hypothetical protein ACRD4F_15545 [Candidatus Angelobacter sp.]